MTFGDLVLSGMVSVAVCGAHLAGIPAPLGLGRTLLAYGSEVCGFICEGAGLAGARDISTFGGWRAWRASLG